LSLGLVAAQAPPNIKARQEKQDARTKAGRKSGELTKKEAARLVAKDAALDAKIRRDRKDGGGLTPRERAKIEKLQDKQSKDIAKQKHDAQKK
jgi:hypothetical protein